MGATQPLTYYFLIVLTLKLYEGLLLRFFHAVIRTLSACWSRHSVATFHFFRRFCWERRFRYFKNSTIFPNAHAYTTEMNSEKPSSLKVVSSVIVVDSYYYHIKQASWTCFNMDVCIRTLNGMALMPANWKIGPSSNGKNFCFLLLLSPPNHHLLASEALGFWPWGVDLLDGDSNFASRLHNYVWTQSGWRAIYSYLQPLTRHSSCILTFPD